MNTRAVSEWNIEIQRRRAVLLDRLLLAATISGFAATISVYPGLPETMSALERMTEMAPFLVGWLVVLIAWRWRGLSYRIRASIVLLLAYSLSMFIFRRGGLPGSGRVWLLLLPAMAFVLVGPRGGVAAGVVSILTYAIFALAFSQNWIVPLVTEDPTALGTWISEGGSFLLMAVILTLILWSFGQSWVEALSEASAVNRQLQTQTRELEKTNERLHRQTSQLQASAEIARAGSSILDPEKLLAEVVHWIQEGFSPMGVYYVGLFLLDETQGEDRRPRLAVLRAATGEAGQLLLEMGYKLELSETSTIGWCIIHRQARVALGMRKDTVQFNALPMPHTRSEIALPLRSRGHILGALSAQSTQEAAFSEADIAVLQTMADQVALAIDNARLFSQTESALKEVQAVQQRYLGQAWREFLDARPVTRVDYTRAGTETAGDQNGHTEAFLRQAQREAMEHGRAVVIEAPPRSPSTSSGQAVLVVPLKLREQVIGTMTLHETRYQRPWTAEQVNLEEAIAEQVALTVENLRLMDETQRRATRERLVGEIAGQVRASMDPDTILKTTVRELGRALGAQLATVEITGLGGGSVGDRPQRGGDRPQRAE